MHRRLKYIQKIKDSFRTRFRTEYLSQLINRGTRKLENIKVGDIVLVGCDNIKRISWPLAKIVELYPGKNNISKVAKLKLASGELMRLVQHIYPLEINWEEEFEN